MIHRFRDEHFYLSNMYPLEHGVIDLDGQLVSTTEHAYQAHKFVNEEVRQKIREAKDGFQAKRDAHKFILAGAEVLKEWDILRLGAMEEYVKQKFNRHDDLAMLLRNTGKIAIVEGNSWDDNFWGESPVGSPEGKNWLGKIIMNVRAELVRVDVLAKV